LGARRCATVMAERSAQFKQEMAAH